MGFFDILGYRSFLKSGRSEVTFRVVDILHGLPQTIRERSADLTGDAKDSLMLLDRVKPSVVSDSILLRLSCGKNGHDDNKGLLANAFFVVACVLERMMFDAGLPLRGAIAFGDFIFTGNVFRGMASP